MESVLFTNVRILEGQVRASPYLGSVLVEGNRIKRISRSGGSIASGATTVIDAAGATLMPGMTEAHTHFSWNDAATLSAIQRMPLEDIAVLQDKRRILAVMKDGEFHRAPPLRRDARSEHTRWAA